MRTYGWTDVISLIYVAKLHFGGKEGEGEKLTQFFQKDISLQIEVPPSVFRFFDFLTFPLGHGTQVLPPLGDGARLRSNVLLIDQTTSLQQGEKANKE